MALLNDLDPWAWAATFVAVVVFCLVTVVNLRDWWNHQEVDFFDGRGTLIGFFGIAFLVGAFNSYSPNANAPRKSVEGDARLVGETHGKGSYNKYICATSCQFTGGYALDLRDEASDAVRIGSKYVFTYFEKPSGNAFTGISLRVIQISDPVSGTVLYQLDIANHLYRIATYLMDFALLAGSGLLGEFLNRSFRRRHPRAGSNENGITSETENEAAESGSISLQLESKDAS